MTQTGMSPHTYRCRAWLFRTIQSKWVFGGLCHLPGGKWYYLYWLVASNMFYFPFHIWVVILPNWLSLHSSSEGLAATTNQLPFCRWDNPEIPPWPGLKIPGDNRRGGLFDQCLHALHVLVNRQKCLLCILQRKKSPLEILGRLTGCRMVPPSYKLVYKPH